MDLSTWERGIQSLGPLLEMPFIDLDDTSKTSAVASLDRLSTALTNKEVEAEEVAAQTDKILRNANLSAGNNRMLREPGHTPLNHLMGILKTFKTHDR